MNNDPLSDAHELCEKQKSWNADYYHFLDRSQRILIEFGQLFPDVMSDIERMIRSGQAAEALATLTQTKNLLARHFQSELEMVQKHHGFVSEAMNNYQRMVMVLRDYSAANDDRVIMHASEIQLQGIDEFSLAGIAHLSS